MAKCRGRIFLSSFLLCVCFFFCIIEKIHWSVGVEYFLKQKDIPLAFFVYRNIPLSVQGSLASCVALVKAFVS